jgi:hypothetical protein
MKKDTVITIDIGTPEGARQYVRQFCDDYEDNFPTRPGFITLNTGKRIDFDKMSDEEAVVAAMCLHDLVVKAAKRAIRH